MMRTSQAGGDVWRWRVAAIAAAVFALVLGAPNDLTDGDPRGCFLTAHALLNTGSLDLSPWPQLAPATGDYRFHSSGGEVHYALGFGTAVLAAPVVWMAERAGVDVTTWDGDRRLQRVLAAGCVAALFALGWLLFALVLAPAAAVAASLAFTLGTAYASTVGTAFWNLGPTVVALTGAVVLVARHRWRGDLRPTLLGVCLGIALFVRPTAALPAGLGLLYVAAHAPRRLPAFLLGLAPWLVAFLLISRWAHGTWLPVYYQALGQEQQWIPQLVLEGQLISPGRGILVFTPFFAPLLLWALLRAPWLQSRWLGLAGVAWFALHAVAIARHLHWWGGTCFGPRLATDVVPALMLTAAVVAEDWRTLRPGRIRRGTAVGFGLLAVLAIGIHVVQGLYNPAVIAWNRAPDVERHWEGIYDWRWPQFLATPARNRERALELESAPLAPLAAGTTYGAASDRLAFVGWDGVEGTGDLTWRWNRDPRPAIVWRAPAPRRLRVALGADGLRQVTVLVDGVAALSTTIEGFGPHVFTLAAPAGGGALANDRHVLEVLAGDARTVLVTALSWE